MLPPLPGWDGLHPLIIHFPLALLLVAPLLVVTSLVWRQHSHAFGYAALFLMVLGTAATYIAVSTGEAAGELAERGGAVEVVLEHHESMAERTQVVFTVITIVYAFIVLAPLLLKRALAVVPWTIVNAAFLVFYVGGAVLLVNTGHEGGRLVHEFGVHAMMSPGGASLPPAGIGDDDDH
ncbi:MAG: hypothetical protein GC168_09110 [Candidatus Hydrogenedens sp.]|nr:hypothetical protein [Candidatus Hydrogenedens sp.]